MVATTGRVEFPWILNRQRDLLFYIGGTLAGWFYVAIILLAIQTLNNPLVDTLATISIGVISIPLNLELLVVVSWAVILDAPHLWATLARTIFDVDEWRSRGKILRISFLWFLLGPMLILIPFVLASRFETVSVQHIALGSVFFFSFARLWAYYHIVRQHWGFFSLYKRRAHEQNKNEHKLDTYFFNAAMYLPLIIFLSSPYFASASGISNLSLYYQPGAFTAILSIIRFTAIVALSIVLILYAYHQIQMYVSGKVINGSKLLFLAPIIPLHVVAVSHPVISIFLVPLVTVGHNIQYHQIVYQYARHKYDETNNKLHKVPKLLFKNFYVYAFFGIIFTLLFYRGPLVSFVSGVVGGGLDAMVFNSLGMMAGIRNPAGLGLGEHVIAGALVGFALQHYYLDSKIWRVSKDQQVAKHLGVDSV